MNGYRRRTVGVVWAVALFLCGCQPAAVDTDPDANLVLADLSTTVTLPTEVDAGLVVQRLRFFAEPAALAAVTSMLESVQVDPAVGAAWHANGFRLGSIRRSNLALLLANLPPLHAADRSRIMLARSAAPLRLAQRGAGEPPISIHLPGEAGGRIGEGGYFELQVKVDRAGSQAHLSLQPAFVSRLRGSVPLLENPEALRLVGPLPGDRIWVITAEPERGAGSPSLASAMLTERVERQWERSILLLGLDRTAGLP